MLIALCGKLGSGKDFMAQAISRYFLENWKISCVILGVADYLKLQTADEENIPIKSMLHQKTAEIRTTLRQKAKQSGNRKYVCTIKNHIEILKSRGYNIFIISDIRTKLEYNWIRYNRGILIEIIAPMRSFIRSMMENEGHLEKSLASLRDKTEVDLDDTQVDYQIQNDYGQELLSSQQITHVLNKIFSGF